MNLNNVYSPMKIFHHQDKIAQMKRGEQPNPICIQLMLCDHCNMACSFCSFRMPGYDSNQLFGETSENGVVNNNPYRIIPYNKCLEIVDDAVEMGVKAFHLTGSGEPTVHPQHKQVMEYILSKGLDLAVVTNGLILREGVEEIYSKCKWVRISVDAGNADTYSKMRVVSKQSFDKTLSNIRKIVETIKRNNSDTIVGVGFVTTAENYREIYEATKLIKSLGVNNIRISAMFNPDNFEYFKEFYQEAKQNAANAKLDFEDKSFTVFNRFGDRVQDLIDENPDYKFCGYMNVNTIIAGDQNVYTCCVNSFNERGLIGSVKNQRFKELWSGEPKKTFFSKFDSTKCVRCMYSNVNRLILYAISENPDHVNYI